MTEEASGATTPPSGQGADDALNRLSADTAAFVRQEITRLRGEVIESARRAGWGTVALGAAGVCGVLALHAGSLTALRALEAVLPRGAAALVLTTVYAGAAGSAGAYGVSRLRAAGLIPRES